MNEKITYLKDKDYFTTPDLNLTACLLCLGYELTAIDRARDQKLFIIKRDEGLDEMVREYFAHHLTVDPLQLVHTLKDLKTRLYHVRS
jgi:hypothetical protein